MTVHAIFQLWYPYKGAVIAKGVAEKTFFKVSIPLDPIHYIRVHMEGMAEIYRLLGRNEEAISQLETAKELFVQAGNPKAAIDALRTILALNPPDANMYQRMLVELEAQATNGN